MKPRNFHLLRGRLLEKAQETKRVLLIWVTFPAWHVPCCVRGTAHLRRASIEFGPSIYLPNSGRPPYTSTGHPGQNLWTMCCPLTGLERYAKLNA
jgi:hypothetical protein